VGPRTVIRRPDNEPRLFTIRWWGWTARWVVEELRLGWRTATVWPKPTKSKVPDRALRTLMFFVGLMAVAAIAFELLIVDVRDWTSDRPVFVGILSAVAVLTPITFVFERLIEAREAQNWRPSAIAGVQTYMWQADRFNDRFLRMLLTADEQIRQPEEPQSLHAVTVRLALRQPEVYERVSQLVRAEADANGQLALSVVSTIALYPPMGSYVDRVWAIQDQLRAIADECIAIAFIRGSGDGPPPEQAVPILKQSAQTISDLAFARQSALMDLRIDIDQLDGSGPSAASEAQDATHGAV
jgi:hypothetical protein